MKNLSPIKIIIGIVVLIISLTILQRIIKPKYIETIKTETITDSTTIDSLKKEILRLESIPPETTFVTIPIPTPQKEDSLLKYTFPYADSLISSVTKVWAKDEVTKYTFDYFYRNRFVREKETIITNTIYRTKTITITKTKSNRAYLSLGAETGITTENFSFSLKVSYTNVKGETFATRYDPFNNGYYISYTRPIRFKLPF